uniref:Uncharacterized protein n=1 Tax=Macaca fascicularis TaxID=9541 RepID=Q2PG15_MACFA|nr:hypothetical protein [Macaca fascicularis]
MPSSAPLGGPRPPPPAVSQTERLPVLGGQGLLRVDVPPSAGKPVGEGAAGKKRRQAGGRVAPRGRPPWKRLTLMSEGAGLFLPPCRVGGLSRGASLCSTETLFY